MTATAILELRAVTKHLGGRPVLRDLAMTIAQTETVAILGPNGSGKSTLLRLAATLSRPDAGDILIAATPTRQQPHLARRNLSVLTQAAPTYAELTPHEHLQWWARLQGEPATPQQIEQATVECGLTAQAHKPAGTLSRGQQQRLALAMALLPERPLLILDEPFTALDAQGLQWLESKLAERRGKRATLLALHDAAQAHRLADRVLTLEHGRLA